jgi:PAS domain S-box-containing protein
MESLFAALSVGSIVQNIEFYLFLSCLLVINLFLIKANRDKKAKGLFVTTFDGTPVKQLVLIDINQKARMERELATKTAELEIMLERVTDAFYMVDSNWNFTYVNEEYERLQQRNRADLLGKNVWELFPYGKERRYFREYDHALREQVSVHFEEFNAFNGMWVSASAYPIKSGLAIYFRDITEKKLNYSAG